MIVTRCLIQSVLPIVLGVVVELPHSQSGTPVAFRDSNWLVLRIA